jgi:hypothetical protein
LYDLSLSFTGVLNRPAEVYAEGWTRATIGAAALYIAAVLVANATATTFSKATIGGRFTKAPPGNPFTGFLIEATDSGKFSNAPDTFGIAFLLAVPPQDSCPTTVVFVSPVVEGEITIHDSL